MAAEEGLTLARFRAVHGLTAAQWARHCEAGTAPIVHTYGRKKIITFEAARAWQLAEGQRVIDSFVAQIGADNPQVAE